MVHGGALAGCIDIVTTAGGALVAKGLGTYQVG